MAILTSELLGRTEHARAKNPEQVAPTECDHCGSADVSWVKCKLICRTCRQIIRSCADL